MAAFQSGVPPAKQGDYAYLLHIIRSMKITGKGACVLPHGVLFRGNAEGVIRRNLIQRGVIKGIIGLPANLFYGTGIPVCLILLDKEHAQASKGIFMIDVSKGFRKDGPKNRLREQDIHRIVDTYNRQLETPGYSRMVPVTEISTKLFAKWKKANTSLLKGLDLDSHAGWRGWNSRRAGARRSRA